MPYTFGKLSGKPVISTVTRNPPFLFVLKVNILAEHAPCGEDVDGRVRPVLLHSRAAGTESRSRRFDLTDGFEEEAQLQVVQMVCFLLLTFLSTRLILQLNSGTAFSARAAMLHTLCNSFLYASRLSFPSLFTSPIFCYLFKVHAISKGLSLARGRCKKCNIYLLPFCNKMFHFLGTWTKLPTTCSRVSLFCRQIRFGERRGILKLVW